MQPGDVTTSGLIALALLAIQEGMRTLREKWESDKKEKKDKRDSEDREESAGELADTAVDIEKRLRSIERFARNLQSLSVERRIVVLESEAAKRGWDVSRIE